MSHINGIQDWLDMLISRKRTVSVFEKYTAIKIASKIVFSLG